MKLEEEEEGDEEEEEEKKDNLHISLNDKKHFSGIEIWLLHNFQKPVVQIGEQGSQNLL